MLTLCYCFDALERLFSAAVGGFLTQIPSNIFDETQIFDKKSIIRPNNKWFLIGSIHIAKLTNFAVIYEDFQNKIARIFFSQFKAEVS